MHSLIAKRLASRTLNAYSYNLYGPKRWLACIRLLLKRGYSEEETEAILRSSWMRRAGDRSQNTYGYVNSADLVRFLDLKTPLQRQVDVAELTRETFGG